MLSSTRVSHCCMALVAALALPACGRRATSDDASKKVDLPSAEAIAKCLPDGVTLETITTDLQDSEGTVAEELAKLKAAVKDKTLVDGRGREIRFYTPQEEGRAMRGEPGYRALVAKYTVVLLMPQ